MRQPMIALPADIRDFDGYTWHAAPVTYLNATIDAAGVLPLIVPAFGAKVDVVSVIGHVDGLLVTGSRTNVHPEHYGEEATEHHEPFDAGRDSTTLPLIREALRQGVPVLAICRGLQELNVALGGTLATEIQEREGIMDHRAPVHTDNDIRFAIRHPVEVKAGSCLAAIIGPGPVQVNSLHRQAIEKLAPSLEVDATADDGTIEAASVRDAKGFAVGVQWHPEYWALTDAPSKALFEAFGNAVRDYAARRQQAVAAE